MNLKNQRPTTHIIDLRPGHDDVNRADKTNFGDGTPAVQSSEQPMTPRKPNNPTGTNQHTYFMKPRYRRGIGN